MVETIKNPINAYPIMNGISLKASEAFSETAEASEDNGLSAFSGTKTI